MNGDEREDEGGPLGFDADDDPTRSSRPRAAELLAAGDEPPGGPPPTRVSGLPRGASRYGWFVGVVLVVLMVVVTVNSLRTDGVSSRGLAAGTVAPPFAAPLALSELDGDVNVATKAGQGDAGDVAACSIHRPDVFNLCDAHARGPVVLAFFAIRGGSCIDELDEVERVRVKHPDVQFVGVSIRGDRGDLRDIIRERGWGFPIAYDRDGVLANLYGVAVCPQITFIRRGGRTFDTTLGVVGAEDLETRVRALERGRGQTPSTTTTPRAPS